MIDFINLPIRIEAMRVEDIDTILAIERVSFSTPWSARAYDYELRYNDLAHYFVARLQPSATRPRNWLARYLRKNSPIAGPSIIGYVGFWLMAGEAHISTVAVSPEYRRRSFGELILVFTLETAMEMSAHEATLEVRASNTGAQELYLKYGFVQVGRRKGYYTDDNEDALIMTTPRLSSAEYQQRFQRLKQILLTRLQNSR